MFDLKVINAKRIIFDDAVERVLVDGNDTEYEFLSFHGKTLGLLREGNIIIDNKYAIPISQGVASFIDNKCTILVESMPGAND